MSPYQFFLKNAGYSYDPATETEEQGRRRCARALASAEAAATRLGYSYEWEIDPEIDSHRWGCIMRDPAGRVAQSIWGIDFGPDGEPWGDPYRRVMEAEIALLEQCEIDEREHWEARDVQTI